MTKIDFDQLEIENNKYQISLEEKNKEMIQVRGSIRAFLRFVLGENEGGSTQRHSFETQNRFDSCSQTSR